MGEAGKPGRWVSAAAALGLAACLLWLMPGLALAADRAASAVELDKAQEQIRTLEKDLSVLREVSAARLEAQDKRLADLALATAQQANHLAAISNQTTTVGNYIGLTSILITVIGIFAGFAAYFGATSRAEKEAREASGKWFEQNAARLASMIEALRQQASTASSEITAHTDRVASSALAAEQQVASSAQAFKQLRDDAANQILQNRHLKDGSPQTPEDEKAIQAVQQASNALKEKPESSFTADDHYTRGLDHFSNGNYQAAHSAFEEAIARLGNSGGDEKIARFLFAKGVALGALNKSKEAIAAYDQIDQRFGADPAPALRELVTNALFNKGVRLGALNKSEQAIAVYDQLDQRFGADPAPALREQVANALYNKGITLGALDKSEQAIAVYDQIDQRFGAAPSPALREAVAKALVNKGVRLGALNRSEEEIAVYDQLDQHFGTDPSPALREAVAKALVNKGVRLGALNKSEQAIAVYDQVDQRFGADPARALRELVAKALNGSGFGRILAAKLVWKDNRAEAMQSLQRATADLRRALERSAPDDKAMILGNLGYALFLSSDVQAAQAPTRECLQLGGQKLLDGQRADAQQHRIEPEDSEYEALLQRIWDSLQPPAAA